MHSRAAGFVVCLVAAISYGNLGMSGQNDSATRRLSRVPAPVGPAGRVEDLYTASYALVVSVSRYDSPAWASLDSISEEVANLKTAFLELGFDQVEELRNPSGNELRRGVEQFISRYGYNSGARLVFFFSGHGHTLDQGRRGYFVPRDAPDPEKDEAGFRGIAISMDQVATWSRDLTARHALFAFDSCFSGTVFRTRDRVVPQPISALTAKKVRAFLSAGDAGEAVPARSVFTPMFTRALRGAADLNHDGFVTGTELGNWVQARVIEYGTRQTPQFGKLRDPDFDEGDLVFAVPDAVSARDVEKTPQLVETPARVETSPPVPVARSLSMTALANTVWAMDCVNRGAARELPRWQEAPRLVAVRTVAVAGLIPGQAPAPSCVSGFVELRADGSFGYSRKGPSGFDTQKASFWTADGALLVLSWKNKYLIQTYSFVTPDKRVEGSWIDHWKLKGAVVLQRVR